MEDKMGRPLSEYNKIKGGLFAVPQTFEVAKKVTEQAKSQSESTRPGSAEKASNQEHLTNG